MDLFLDILTGLFLITGTLFVLIGSLGLIRLPDIFTRCHAAGIADTLGMALILFGLVFQAGFSLVSAKLALIAVFFYFTSPVSSHATVRAAIVDGHKPLLDPDVDIGVTKIDPSDPDYRVHDLDDEPEREDAPSRT